MSRRYHAVWQDLVLKTSCILMQLAHSLRPLVSLETIQLLEVFDQPNGIPTVIGQVLRADEHNHYSAVQQHIQAAT